MKRKKLKKYATLFFAIAIILTIIFSTPKIKEYLIKRSIEKQILGASDDSKIVEVSDTASTTPEVKKASHVTVPAQVKAVYMSAWVASGATSREKIIDMIDKTDANAVVIDVKDYTGKISFEPKLATLTEEGCFENKIKDIDAFIEELHAKNIYVIGRVAVFQDPCMVSKEPTWAVQNKNGGVWKDRKAITWLDASNKNSWPYFADLARETYDRGFDEVNFDYIRFPTDGDMAAMRFSGLASSTKAHVIRDFLKYIDQELRGGLGANYVAPKIVKAVKLVKGAATSSLAVASTTPEVVVPSATSLIGTKVYNIPEFNAPKNRVMISADVFGLVTEASDDMGIGQVFEDMLPYLDYMSPMVYPSHYAKGYSGYPKPATEPYNVVYKAMTRGVARATTMGQDPLKLRPWLQDFNMGATYTPAMVTAQIKAVTDSKLDSFLLWDPANKYTSGAVALKK